jgi:predicted dinucleotide-binding enzyme
MTIAIIGAGNVGSALGRGWLGAGEDVVFGVPQPADIVLPPGARHSA